MPVRELHYAIAICGIMRACRGSWTGAQDEIFEVGKCIPQTLHIQSCHSSSKSYLYLRMAHEPRSEDEGEDSIDLGLYNPQALIRGEMEGYELSLCEMCSFRR